VRRENPMTFFRAMSRIWKAALSKLTHFDDQRSQAGTFAGRPFTPLACAGECLALTLDEDKFARVTRWGPSTRRS